MGSDEQLAQSPVVLQLMQPMSSANYFRTSALALSAEHSVV
jgi:hypothetical protein